MGRVARARPSKWADIARAYLYLLAAGWRLFVRRQRLDRWLATSPAPETVQVLTPKEQELTARASRWTHAAARHPFPWARCLQRSLALCLWLERGGVRPSIRLGVRKDGATISAHAWVQYKGHVLNDSEQVGAEFATLAPAYPTGGGSEPPGP